LPGFAPSASVRRGDSGPIRFQSAKLGVVRTRRQPWRRAAGESAPRRDHVREAVELSRRHRVEVELLEDVGEPEARAHVEVVVEVANADEGPRPAEVVADEVVAAEEQHPLAGDRRRELRKLAAVVGRPDRRLA